MPRIARLVVKGEAGRLKSMILLDNKHRVFFKK